MQPLTVRELKACDNPLCDRAVSRGVLYCCTGCANAHEGRFEIHEQGGHPLCSHSTFCDQRHAERGPYKGFRS